ncbi:hypothetical protein ID866_9883 [Astraeus odoratus]|nr:hypothetical protein ID866_9883 [Astraeus odoratus]
MLQQVPKLASPSRAIPKMSDLWRFHQTENTLQQALMMPQFGFGMSSYVLKLETPSVAIHLKSSLFHSPRMEDMLCLVPLMTLYSCGMLRQAHGDGNPLECMLPMHGVLCFHQMGSMSRQAQMTRQSGFGMWKQALHLAMPSKAMLVLFCQLPSHQMESTLPPALRMKPFNSGLLKQVFKCANHSHYTPLCGLLHSPLMEKILYQPLVIPFSFGIL